jgi:hypothetical protein
MIAIKSSLRRYSRLAGSKYTQREPLRQRKRVKLNNMQLFLIIQTLDGTETLHLQQDRPRDFFS